MSARVVTVVARILSAPVAAAVSPWLGPLPLGLFSLTLVARDVAVLLQQWRLVPHREGEAGALTHGARRLAGVRVMNALGVAAAAALLRSPAVLALVPLAYGLSSAVTKSYFPAIYGGPSYPRVILKALIRSAVGSNRQEKANQDLFPVLYIGVALWCVFYLSVGRPPTTTEVRTVLTIGFLPDARPNAGAEPVDAPTASATRPAARPEDPTPTEVAPQDRTLEEICGTTAMLPTIPDPPRAELEDAWHRLGGETAGCPASWTPFGEVGVVVWLHHGKWDPAALVSGGGTAPALVRTEALPMLRRILRGNVLVDVDALHVASSSSFQIFRTTSGCKARIENHGLDTVVLDEAATSAVFRAIAASGGAIDRIQTVTKNEGEFRVDGTVSIGGQLYPLAVTGQPDGTVEWSVDPDVPAEMLPSAPGCPVEEIERVRVTG